jgi:phosphate uptake regulator
MKRKVIKQGHNTLTITLPAKWVEDHRIMPGDEINIDEKGSAIVITKESNGFILKKEIDITKSVLFLERELYSLYKKGYDEIDITSEDPSQLAKVQQILTEAVVGFEIISQTKTMCKVKNVAEIQDSEFDSILRRTSFLLISMDEGIYDAMKNGDINPIANLRFMEKTNNRYTGFLRRVLNKKGHGRYENEKLLYCFIEYTEKIADELKFLCLYFQEEEKRIKNIDTDVLALYKRMNTLLAASFEIYYKYNKNKMAELYAERKSIIRETHAMLNKSTAKNSVMLHYLLTITQYIADLIALTMTMQE